MTTDKAAAPVGAVPQGDDEWLPTIERDEAYDREYIRMAGWEVQTKGKGSTFRICDPNGDRLPIPDSPYLHDTLTRMAHDIFASHIKTMTDHQAALASQAARMAELAEQLAEAQGDRNEWLTRAAKNGDRANAAEALLRRVTTDENEDMLGDVLRYDIGQALLHGAAK